MKHKITYMRLSDIKPYFNNPRRNDDAVEKVAESIQAFGFQAPIIIDKKGVIIAGHTRWKAALKLNLKEVPVIISDMPEEKAKAYRIMDNRTSDFSGWDWEKLNLEIEEMDLDFVEMFDFNIPDETFPEFDVDVSTDEVTDEDLEKAEKKLENKGKESDKVSVMCPECGHEFEVSI